MKLLPFYQFLLLIFVTLCVYYPTLFVPFNSLDDQIFASNLLNQQGFSLNRHFSPGGASNYYRPLLTLSFEIDKYVGGLQESFMHLINVLVHLLNVILVWLIARRFGKLLQRPSVWLPLIAALLFALHPINTEAVNWIAGRTDLLAGTFVFISLYALLEFIDRRNLLWGVISAVALFGGALCKETALFFVPGACFLLFCRLARGRLVWPLRWVILVLYGVSITIYFYLRWGALHTDRGLGHTAKLAAQTIGIAPPASDGVVSATIFPWLDALTVVFKASGFYVFKLFQPLPLNFAIHQIDTFFIIPGIALFIVLIVFIYRRQMICWPFLVSASIAVSALFVIFTQLAWTPIAERYMYLPCGPFVIGIVYVVGTKFTPRVKQRTTIVLISLFLGGAAWLTASRNVVWQDNLTLYQDAVRQSPDFAPARNQLALALKTHNRNAEANEILASNKMSVSNNASLNVASALFEQGDYAAARDKLLHRLKENPGGLEPRILEMLVRVTSEYLGDINDETLKRNGYKDILVWLERIKEISSTGFNYYRIGRIQLLLEDKVAAQHAFAEAARRFPADSIYFKPATKLATDLAQ